jgi:hypothetical protein
MFGGLTAILREAWNTTNNTEDKIEKIQALSLAKECYSMKLDLLTNATVVDDAIRFVSQKSNEKLKSSAVSNEDDNESKEPNYDEDEDHLEDEQEVQTGEMTINRVFEFTATSKLCQGSANIPTSVPCIIL